MMIDRCKNNCLLISHLHSFSRAFCFRLIMFFVPPLTVSVNIRCCPLCPVQLHLGSSARIIVHHNVCILWTKLGQYSCSTFSCAQSFTARTFPAATPESRSDVFCNVVYLWVCPLSLWPIELQPHSFNVLFFPVSKVSRKTQPETLHHLIVKAAVPWRCHDGSGLIWCALWSQTSTALIVCCCYTCASLFSFVWLWIKPHPLRKQDSDFILTSYCQRRCLDEARISEFVSTEHGSLVFGTAFCRTAISRICLIAIIKLHASLGQIHIPQWGYCMFQLQMIQRSRRRR